MSLGTTPVSNTTIGQNQIPASSVAVPNHSGGNLSTLRGANPATDSNGNELADASMAVPDGNDITQGATTDVSVTGDTAGTISAKLRGLLKLLSESFGSASNITAATTFSGVPTISQIAPNSSINLTNPGNHATFLLALEIAASFNGTISFYGLEPDGASLQLISAHQRGSSTWASSVAINVSSATNQLWAGNCAGFKAIYIVCTTYTNGTASAQVGLSSVPYAVAVASANLTSVGGSTLSLGQAAMASSLPVAIASNQGAIGSVTANAGTNLNTSLLALESGGNLATLAGGISSSKYQVNLAQVLGATLSTTNPVLTESNVQNWVRVGQQGYFATTDVYTPSNTNNALSIFNPNASGKTLILLSVVINYGAATQVARARITNSNPSFATTLSNANFDLGNLNTGGGTSPVASVTYATTSTSVPALSAASIAYNAAQTVTTGPNEMISPIAPVVLAANTGLAVYFTNTAAGNLSFSVKWIEI